MTPQQLEALTLGVVDHVRRGQPVEDDRVELKAAWPRTSKARQLAGAANRSRGSYLVYVIGLDESSGAVVPVDAVDVADWWAQISACFDGVPPELKRHLTVPVGPGEAVSALLFETDRAPYVVKTTGASELEVPIREGTRTRSARRDEIIRMIAPTLTTPPAVLLVASIGGSWDSGQPASGRPVQAERTNLWGEVSIYIEYLSGTGIVLPTHEMRGELLGGDYGLAVVPRVHAPSSLGQAPLPPPPLGATCHNDGVVVTGPGSFSASLSIDPLPGDHREELRAVREWQLRLVFGVTGAETPIRLDAVLTPDSSPRPTTTSQTYESLSRWCYEWARPSE